MTTNGRPAPAPDIAADAACLEAVLRALLEGHERLGQYLESKREAIRVADIDRISALCRQEHLVVQRLADLEKQRLTILGRLTEAVSPQASRVLTLREVASAADAESLHRHLTGILQAVQVVLSATTTYGARGRLDVGQPLDHCVDVKS
jgi:hypothetical protein